MRLTTLIQDLPVKKIQGNAEIEIKTKTKNGSHLSTRVLLDMITSVLRGKTIKRIPRDSYHTSLKGTCLG